MRLFLLPISTRRTLIYCQRINVAISEQQTIVDKATGRAAKLWASWEKKDSGWQKKVVDLGNNALKRIPYEEWGLKSIPPLSARRKVDEISGKEEVSIYFPQSLISKESVTEVLGILGTEREALHRSRLIYSIVGMPLTAPIALIPVIPNLPFFYLVFRAWSHWRALSGSRHIQFLIDRKLAKPKPSPILDTVYAAGIMRAVRDKTVIKGGSTVTPPLRAGQGSDNKQNEALLLSRWNSKLIVRALEIPELEVELDRAIWQVETALKVQQELRQEKEELDKATSKATSKTTTQTRDQEKN